MCRVWPGGSIETMAIGRLAICCIALAFAAPVTAVAAAPAPWLFNVAGTGNMADQAFHAGAFATATEIGAFDVAALPDGGFLVADTAGYRVTRVRPDGRIGLAAGGGRTTRDGVPATSARIDPVDVAALPDGSFVIADAITARVRRVGPDGRIASVSPRIDGLKAVDAVPGGGFVAAGAARVEQIAPARRSRRPSTR